MAINPKLRSRTTQSEVLLGFARRLREIPDMNTQNVVIDEDPVPSLFPGGLRCLVVAPGNGQFALGASHDRSFTEDAGVIVGIYIMEKRDRAGRAESRLVKFNSLLYWKRLVLSYLAVADISLGTASMPWEPTVNVGADEKPLLRSYPRPIQVTAPCDVQGHPSWRGLQIHYSAPFDWDLYGIFE